VKECLVHSRSWTDKKLIQCDAKPGQLRSCVCVRSYEKLSYLLLFWCVLQTMMDLRRLPQDNHNALINQDWIMVQVSAFLALRDKACFRQACKAVWHNRLCWDDSRTLEQRIVRSFVCTRYGSFQDALLAYEGARAEYDELERRGYTMDYSCMMDARERHVRGIMHFGSALNRMCRLIGCCCYHGNYEFVHKRQDVVAKYNWYINADRLSSEYIESHLYGMIRDFHSTPLRVGEGQVKK